MGLMMQQTEYPIFLLHEHERASMAKDGRIFIEATYTWENVCQKISAKYKPMHIQQAFHQICN